MHQKYWLHWAKNIKRFVQKYALQSSQKYAIPNVFLQVHIAFIVKLPLEAASFSVNHFPLA